MYTTLLRCAIFMPLAHGRQWLPYRHGAGGRLLLAPTPFLQYAGNANDGVLVADAPLRTAGFEQGRRSHRAVERSKRMDQRAVCARPRCVPLGGSRVCALRFLARFGATRRHALPFFCKPRAAPVRCLLLQGMNTALPAFRLPDAAAFYRHAADPRCCTAWLAVFYLAPAGGGVAYLPLGVCRAATERRRWHRCVGRHRIQHTSQYVLWRACGVAAQLTSTFAVGGGIYWVSADNVWRGRLCALHVVGGSIKTTFADTLRHTCSLTPQRRAAGRRGLAATFAKRLAVWRLGCSGRWVRAGGDIRWRGGVLLWNGGHSARPA